jgi:hypothetical protein
MRFFFITILLSFFAVGVSFPQEEPVKCSLKQFHDLQWLKGSWRAWISKKYLNYERFTFLNDSTIHNDSYIDSAMTDYNGNMSIMLRKGNIFLDAEYGFWIAVKYDSTSILFSVADRSTHYINGNRYILFTSNRNGTWTRNYYWVDKNGKRHSDVYHIEHIK